MAVNRRFVLPGEAGAGGQGGRAGTDSTRTSVFAAILAEGSLSRGDVADLLGVAPSTVTKAVTPLLADGYLEETDAARTPAPSLGRPSKRLRVNKARHAAIGVKICQDRLIGVLTNLRTEIMDHRLVRLPEHSPGAVLDAVCELAATLAASAPADPDHVLGIGVGLSGHVDAEQRTSRHSALLGWNDVDVAGEVGRRTGLPTVVGNDVNALVVGQRWFGPARDCASFAVVTVGAGIGCGLFLNGGLYTGTSGMAGEIGHVPVQPDGPVCNCGRRGCLEAVASYDAVLRAIEARGGPRCHDIDEAIDLARRGTGPDAAAAAAAFAEAGGALGRALAWLYNMLNPEKLIIAGEGVKAQALFRPSMTEAVRAHTFSTAARDCDETTILIDDTDWARGAACLVIDAAIGALELGPRTPGAPAARP
ncbi:ROK family transcriptional regulator [Streptomyces sp. HPF1205]|uniref:ROK family transcriptional regulator n=1 Tax=Streptomyces sp. HPF1205 TaxID=2873262 RepID=UPI001CEDAD08|nr:ROK family transcriptional regulator [Streptomyces sp. HPF1205]